MSWGSAARAAALAARRAHKKGTPAGRLAIARETRYARHAQRTQPSAKGSFGRYGEGVGHAVGRLRLQHSLSYYPKVAHRIRLGKKK